MKIFILNDTSGVVHSGSDAVMRNFRTYLEGHEIVGTHRVGTEQLDRLTFDKADWVIANGEGTIHHNQKEARYVLKALETAKKNGQKAALLNTIYESMSTEYDEVLTSLDLITARDPWSQKLIESKGVDCGLYVDMCIDDQTILNGHGALTSEIVKGDAHWSAVIASSLWKTKTRKFLNKLDYPVFNLEGEFKDIVCKLTTTKVYVTGQYHAIYAAAAAETPFVAFDSNSHKIRALIDWSGLPIPICYKKNDFERLLRFALKNKQLYVEFGQFIKSLPRHSAKIITNAIS